MPSKTDQVMKTPAPVAAVIAEPISAACGVVVPPAEYFPRLRDICDRHGALLIFDEIITGFGRTGKMFAAEHWDVVPDIMMVAKGLSSGYAPIGATICRRHIAQQFQPGARQTVSAFVNVWWPSRGMCGSTRQSGHPASTNT